jgi:hypothetical protein
VHRVRRKRFRRVSGQMRGQTAVDEMDLGRLGQPLAEVRGPSREGPEQKGGLQ